uniref:Lysosomal trafficking regulator n=1 Tax=Coturnix japonica TaxID=93934 RepID=A0A8C2UAI9_COTJA
MSSASNSLAREFLTDVNRLCNAVVQRAEAKEDEEEETHMAALGQYLVQGRGFILLTTLNSNIDQELTCREELLTLLLSLLPLVWKIPVQEEKAVGFNIPFTVDVCLTKESNSSVKSTQEKIGSDRSPRSSLQASAQLNPRSRKSGRTRKTTHRYSVRDARRSQLSTSDSEGNSDDKNTVTMKHRRSQFLQPFLTYPVRDSYLVGRSDFLPTEVVPNPNPDVPSLENSSQIVPAHELNPEILNEPVAGIAESNLDNSPFDLCHVLLSLLEKVCRFDVTLNHSSALSATVVPTLTEFLSGFGDCCNLSSNTENEVVSAGWTEEPVALVQRMLFRTVLHLMSLDIISTETMPDNLRRNVTDLLKAALKIRICLEKQPDPFAPEYKKTLQQLVQDDFVLSRYRHRALLLPEVVEGVLQILIRCLQSAASNPFYFSQAMDLVHEFIQHQGFKLFEVTVLQMEWLCMKNGGVTGEAPEHLKSLINSIMKIISTVKKVKSEQLHQSVCTRKRHRRCEYSYFMHHHRDLSGLSVSAFKNQASRNPFESIDGEVNYPDRCCCIAVCAHQCLHLLQQVSLSSTCVQILSGIHNVGICCCMDPKSVIVPLLRASKLPILKNFQQHILNILNKFILDQLGGAEASPRIIQASCNICTVDSDQLLQLEDALQGNSNDAGLASSSSCRVQGILPSSGSEDVLLRWDALEAYQDVVFEEDKLRGMQVASHICHLIQKGNAVVQWKLYNCIYNPVLQKGVELACHAQQLGLTTADKHTSSYHSQCLPYEVLQIYLQTLPALLKSRVIRDLFLSCNGVNQMTELNYLDTLRSYSLKVLETLILCLGELQKDQAVPELEDLNDEHKESASDLPASLCSQHTASEIPQSLSKFYAGLKEAYPKKKKFESQDIHVNTINLFLCVAFLCVSKEADGDLDSANDSEDTSGYDSTTSEEQLAQSKLLETDLAKPLFDSLLRVALGTFSTDLDHSEEKVEKESLSQPEDISEEADESQCCSLKLFAEEEGYEADSESNPDSETKDGGADTKAEPECTGPSGYLNDLTENINQGELIYPEICMLELNLLSAGNASLDVLAHVFQSCLKIINQKERNASVLIEQGAVKHILGGFMNILTQTESSFHVCQMVLVDLLVSLMSSQTCSEELTLLLRIFLEKTPCTEILLKGVLKIIETNVDMNPLQYLAFPLLHGTNLSSSSQKSTGTSNSKTAGLLKKAKFSQSKKEADGENLSHQLLSSWHVAPVHLPLVGQNCWPHMSDGFSVSLWFHLEHVHEMENSIEKGKKVKRRLSSVRENSFDKTKSVGMEYLSLGDKLVEDGCIHIISLGSKALMIQIWADVNTGAFIFRMCMDPNDEMKAGLLAQAESPENVFLVGRWQHLAIQYKQKQESKKNIRGELSLWVSGQRKCEINLDYALPRKSSLSSDSNKTFCMIGHCTSSQEELLRLSGRWDLGNLLLFNGAKIGPEEAFYLYACGPDFTSVMPCKYGKTLTECSKYISKDILQCEQIKELFMAKKEVDVGPLIESLAVVYATCCPSQYTIYEPVIRLKGQVKTVPSQRPFSSKEVQSNVLDSHHLKALQPVEYKNLQGILHEIGGTGAFVFLFARVVEISSCEDTQALALQLILSLTKYNQQRIQEMKNCNGYSMIHRVLIKPKCVVGFRMLKTLLEGCCSGEILYINENGQFVLDTDSTAVIQDVQLLEKLLLDWKIWSKAKQGVWETLLAALEILIRANHHQQMFNVKQLLKAQVVHHFLLTCQVLQEHKEGHLASLPREVCRSFVKIIEEVLGSPPDLELLTLVFNFLLAVHPPTNTYVCHNPTNFYFSLHIDGKIFQEKVESLMYLRNSSSGGKSTDGSAFVVTTPTGFAALPLEGKNNKHLRTLKYLPKRLCKSLPASPTSSPQVRRRRLMERSQRSIDDLQNIDKYDYGDLEGKTVFDGHSETIKRAQEDFLSSCESAKTVCDSELTSAEIKEADADLKGKEGDAAPQLLLRRPDNLKGLQKSQSTFAGLGLAFSVHGGSSAIARWPSFADKNALPEEWENLAFSSANENPRKTYESSERYTEDCLVLICCGLYDLLRGVLLILPDVMLEDVMDKLIQPDYLIVLVNHPSPLIQQGVIKLLDAYFNRARREQKEKFLKNRGFSLLANQLYLHQGTQEVVECFLEMLFGRSVGLDEEFDLEDVKNVGLFQKWCVIPVLGLIENSLYDNVLLHNCFCLLLQIINSCSKVADLLLDNGLLYVLCNTLAALNGLETNIPLNDYKLLACDIQQLLVAVAIHACSSSGSQYFRVIEDLIVLLGHLQNSKNTRMQNMAVALQLRVLQAAIELIRTTASSDAQEQAGAAPSLSAAHRAMFQKRKGIAGSRKLSPAQSDALLMKMRSVASEEFNMMMQRRMSQESPIQATETEFVQRLQRLTVLAVNRLIYLECFDILGITETASQSRLAASQLEVPDEEIQQELPNRTNPFLKEMFKMLMEGIRLSPGTSRTSTPKQQWKRILLSCKDTFRTQLGRLLVHILSPARPLQERKQALEMVREVNHQEILCDCLSPTLQHGPKLVLYLYELMCNHVDEMTKEEQTAAGDFVNTLKCCGYKSIPLSPRPKPDVIKALKEDQKKYEMEEGVNKAAWEKTMANNRQNLFQRLDTKSKDISKIAGDITQAVSLSQGMERKKVIQHIRGMYKAELSASRHWQELVQQLTHDRALWYDPVYYPTSWQLDPTEGPNRERRRLQRCYLTIPNKYLLPDRQKQEGIIKPPLSYLFEDKTHSSHSSTVKDKAASEHIRVNRRCISVAPSRETAGELLLGKCGMYFVEDNASDTIEHSSFHGETEPASFSWTYEEIKEVHKRWWQLRDNAVEIFLTNGRTLLLAFDNTKVRNDVYHNILTNNLPNLLEYGNITALTHLWCTGQITNFEYLTHLNKHAGRSFNDLMQYPVFPFILSDYISETLDLNDPSVYRNLVKPIAVQSKEKEDRYVDTYKYLEEEYRKGAREDDPMPPVQPYHYGSHYSNSGTVLHFLVRLPPFTKMFLAYQDQSFDIPDRTFHSTNTTWRLSSYESMTDVKELIPEFFYLPDFLVNREGFDFGVRQNGDRVNHVNLPPWARNDPRLFILIHRQALESDHVSQTICHWIDLVFGYKQKGKASVQAINVFHPATYFGMDVSAVEDPVQRRALETMIKTYGQTPRQLFHTAHVSRPGSRLIMEGELPAAMGLLVQFAFRETREHTKEIIYPSPLPWIKGLKWGEYVGSPSAPDPVVCFSQPHGERFGSLQALPTKAICGLSRKFCLLMIYSKEQGVRSMHSTDIQWSAILSWGYADNILRLKSKQSEPPVNFIQSSQFHQVTSCAWVPDSCQLFTGSKSGVITAYMNRFTSSTPSEIEMESQVHLYGHTAEITSLFVCKPYSIMISVSKDGTCIIWDLNRLCYVQSLAGHKSPVTAVSASETTGDIATVCDSVGGGSDLRLWTVNGDLVGHVHCRESICSVAFSNQPEGVSVNVIAGGLENGVVRLWSTWDLKPVREITFSKSAKPIVSLTFSCDGHHLFTANSDGNVIAWCRKDQQRLKLPMFYSFLSSYAAG